MVKGPFTTIFWVQVFFFESALRFPLWKVLPCFPLFMGSSWLLKFIYAFLYSGIFWAKIHNCFDFWRWCFFYFYFFLSLLYTCSVFVLSTVLDFYSCKWLGSFFISVSLMAYLPTAQFFFLFVIAYFMLRQVLERLLCTYYWYFQWWTLK